MDLSQHITKAEEAIQKKNFDIAAGYLQQVLSVQPDHGDARRLLCRALRLRHERKPTPRWLARLVGAPHLLSAALCRVTKSAGGQVRALERYLRLDPVSPSVYLGLGQALAAAGFSRSAAAVFQAMTEVDPRSSTPWRMCAACHAQLQELDRALECLDKALALNPRDADADRMRKNLAADVTLRKGAYETAKSSRDLMRDEHKVSQEEAEARIHRTEDELAEEEDKLRKRLEGGGGDARSRRRLAELCARRKDYEEAIRVLEAGREKDDNRADLDDRIGDYRLLSLTHEIDKLRERLAKAPSAGVKSDLMELEQERREQEIKEYQRRTVARPTDLGSWFQYGKALRDGGRLEDAIGAFQKSVKEPKVRTDSLVLLGECFFDNEMLELAEKQFNAALESVAPSSDRGKAVLYHLGQTTEKAGRKDAAKGYFSRIYEMDIHYRDVARRLEALRGR